MKVTFGERLRLARKDAGKSQTFMASMVSVNASTWNRWENNRSLPDLLDLQRIGSQCGLSLDWLVMGIDTHNGAAAHIIFMLDKLRPRESKKLLEWMEVRLESVKNRDDR